MLMDTETVHTVIHHLDNQLSKVELKESNKIAIDHLMELRNNLLLTYRPDPSFDWTFKNKRLLKFFNKEVKWIRDPKEIKF
jgi:hypothetical protein